MIRSLTLALFILFGSALQLQAAPALVESIAALVDGKPIFYSEVMMAMEQFQGNPAVAGLDAQAQKLQVLEKLIDEKVILSRASRDSIDIDQAEVQKRVDAHLQQLARRQKMDDAGLEKAIQAQLGMSMLQYRQKLSNQFGEQMTLARIRQRHIGIITPTRKEVESFYATYKDSLPRQYNCILVSHMQLKVRPDTAIVDSVKQLALRIIDSLDQGIAWDTLAIRHNQDLTSKNAGDIGYYRKGQLEPEYEKAVWRLDLGQYTDKPARTRFGWHIARLTGKKDNEVRTSQILLQTIPSASDSARTLKLLDSLRTVAVAGQDTGVFANLARKYSQDGQTSWQGGRLGWFERSELDSAYVTAVSRLEVGEISEVIRIEDGLHLFRLDDSRQVREFDLTEDYARIEEMAANYMGNRKLQTLVTTWRREVHVDIRLR